MGIFEKGWEVPSPIQEASIPVSLSGFDIIARAKNGTGKTGAYTIPTLQKINVDQGSIQGELAVDSGKIGLLFPSPSLSPSPSCSPRSIPGPSIIFKCLDCYLWRQKLTISY